MVRSNLLTIPGTRAGLLETWGERGNPFSRTPSHPADATQLMPLDQLLKVSTFIILKKKGNKDQEASHHSTMVGQKQHFHITEMRAGYIC
jgi:hypothetical protein